MGIFGNHAPSPFFYILYKEAGEVEISKAFRNYERARDFARENIAGDYRIEALYCGNRNKAKQMLYARALGNPDPGRGSVIDSELEG